MPQATTLKRAAGEVVLIVVGVLIALAASDWQQSVSERGTELKAALNDIAELRSALQAEPGG